VKGILIFALIASLSVAVGLGVAYTVGEAGVEEVEPIYLSPDDRPAQLVYMEEESDQFFRVAVRLYQIEGHSYIVVSRENSVAIQHSDGCQCWPPHNNGGS
jgi:hypothetical protein